MNNTDEDGFVNGDLSRFFAHRESTYVFTERNIVHRRQFSRLIFIQKFFTLSLRRLVK